VSPEYSAALTVLRQQRGLLDQAITALEMLTGERPTPSVTHVLVEPARPQRLLAAARQVKRKYTRKAVAKTAPAAIAPKARDTRVTPPSNDDEDMVYAAIKSFGGSARKEQVAAKTKLTNTRLVNAKNRMVHRGELTVAGHARAARWVLPGGPKEAP
jgi:hypothetical protein